MATKAIIEPTNARSRRTRESSLAAARGILEADGLNAMTMTSVADRAGVTRRAAYMLYALISSDLVEALLVDRRWSQRRLAEALAALFRSTFVRA